jgi:iron complex outermembrane receptor protein
VWGANAVNGVINIITRKASDTQGNYVQAGYGNIEQGFVTARHGGTFDNGGYYRVYAKGFEKSNFEKANGRDAGDDWNSLRTGFRADWDSFTLTGDIYDTKAHEFDRLPNFTPPLFATTLLNQLDYRGGDLLGRWKHDTSSGGLFTLQSYVDYAARLWPQEIDDRRWTFDFEPQYNFPVYGRHSVIVGGDYRFLSMNDTGHPDFMLTPSDRNDNIFSAFIQDKIALSEKIAFTIGSKVEHNDFSGWEVEPNARLSWLPDDLQTVWAAVSRAVRTPTPIEQNATVVLQDSAGGQVALVPNPDFGSEDLIAYEAGYRKQVNEDISFDTALFFNDYENLTNTHLGAPVLVNNGIDPPFLQLPGIFTNSMSGETWGFEVGADWRVVPNWKLSGTYSHLEIYLHQNDNTVPNQEAAEGASPQNQFSVRSNWRINDDWTLDTTFYYVGRLPTGNIDPYARADLNLGYRVNDHLTANLVGQNLLEDHHREIQGGAYIPRSVFGYVTWHF